jgi:hypothetical protein
MVLDLGAQSCWRHLRSLLAARSQPMAAAVVAMRLHWRRVDLAVRPIR